MDPGGRITVGCFGDEGALEDSMYEVLAMVSLIGKSNGWKRLRKPGRG